MRAFTLRGSAVMPRRPRVSTAGMTFHVMNRAARRLPLFECSADYSAFERILFDAIARGDVSLFAYCLMPNHWHLLLSPRVDGSLSRFMHWLTTTHARRWEIVRHSDGQGAVYQGRFRAVPITSDEHFLCACRYVERNPPARRAGRKSRQLALVESVASAHACGCECAFRLAGDATRRLDRVGERGANTGGGGQLPPSRETEALRTFRNSK